MLINSYRISLRRVKARTPNSQSVNVPKNEAFLHQHANISCTSKYPRRYGLSGMRSYHNMLIRTEKTARGSNGGTIHDVLKGITAIYLFDRIKELTLTIPSTKCETEITGLNMQRSLTKMNNYSIDKSPSRWKNFRRKASHALRLFRRLVKLFVAMAPLAAIYPIQRLTHKNDANGAFTDGNGTENADAHKIFLASLEESKDQKLGWYYRLCLYSVECSGAAVIKLMQWASSRPDLFGKEFCKAFCKLQDDTTPHAMKHTEEILRKVYGNDWATRIQLDRKVVGSGCIGQVYKGVIHDSNGKEQQVAVKVMHPNVADAIADDLDLLRLLIKFAKVLPFDMFANLRWMNPEGVIEEFADLLQLQLDLKTEGKNLERFHENFKHDHQVAFPRLIEGFEPHSEVLIESFCEGVPVLQFVKENSNNQKLLSEMCLVGIRTVCQMIFLDNFMHGDLHPGNIFINSKDRKFVLLDAGIATEYSETDHELIVSILSSFIRADGRKAGRLMIDDSNLRAVAEDKAVNETLYIDKIEALTNRANDEEYFMEHLAVYLSYICEAAAKHHVMMNQKFITAALSIQVLEGVSLAMDPALEIWRVANPVILQAEVKRRWSKTSKELVDALGLAKFIHKND